MKLRDPIASAQTMSRSILAAKRRGRKSQQWAIFWHKSVSERLRFTSRRGGIHGCDLDDWLLAERELQESTTQEQRWKAERRK